MIIKTLLRSKLVVALLIAGTTVSVFAYHNCWVDSSSSCGSWDAYAGAIFNGNYQAFLNTCVIDGTWPDTEFASEGAWYSIPANSACAGTCSGENAVHAAFTITSSDPSNIGGYVADAFDCQQPVRFAVPENEPD